MQDERTAAPDGTAMRVVALAALALACRPVAEAPGVPLYPNGATARLPRGQIALLAGPIAKIDAQDVVDQGGRFELLPGCHVIEVDRGMTADGYTLSNAGDPTGLFESTTYALRMKPGATYLIRREVIPEWRMRRVTFSVLEEDARGRLTRLVPVEFPEDIEACRQWETTALRR